MRLEVTWKCDQEPQHARIENTDLDEDYDGENWSDAYVCISGYFGNHNPNMFSVAPDLYEALEYVVRKYDEEESLRWAIDEARTTLAKARGEQ